MTLTFGGGLDENATTLHVELPWLFSIFFTVGKIWDTPRSREVGIAFHNASFWLHLFADRFDHRAEDPWYAKTHSCRAPWSYEIHTDEVLSPDLSKSVWFDSRRERLRRRKKMSIEDQRAYTMKHMEFKTQVQEAASVPLTYSYVLKSGVKQEVQAKARAERTVIRMLWWPLFWGQRTRTEFWVQFSEAIGEGVNTYKGGVLACGGTIKSGQTLMDAVREMERTRKFER